MNFNFSEAKNTMVITTKDIVLVSHDEDDGMWEFLDGEDVKEENAVIVSLDEIVEIDDTLNELYDLLLGYIAYRENKGAEWIREDN